MRFLVLLLGLSFSLTTTTPSYSSDIKLVTGSDYAPYTSPDLPHGGVISEIVKTIFIENGYTVSLQFYPWTRGLKRVATLKSDATFPYAYTTERDLNFFYSRPVHKLSINIFRLKTVEQIYNEPKDLIGLVYCQPLGYKTETELLALLDKNLISRIRADTVDSCLERMLAGRADFVALNSSVVWSAARRLWSEKGAILKIRQESNPLRVSTEHLIISRQHPEGEVLIRAFDDAFEQLLRKGVLHEIWERHVGKDSIPEM